MGKMIGQRVVRLIATLLAVTFLTFLLTALLPGDPVNAILPPDAPRDQATVDRIRAEFNLDDPLLVRYGSWLANAVTGDLGKSYITDQQVTEAIKQRIPITFELTALAAFFALLLAVPVGILGAYREGRFADKSSSAMVQVGLSVPPFIVGIFLIWLFTVKTSFLGLPSTGWNRITTDGLWENLRTAVLPAFALSLAPLAYFSRLLRSDMVGTLKEDFVLSARAKGLKNRYILGRHALRPSSLSLVTIVGIQLGILLSGTVVIEQIFALPGLGSRLLNAIYQRDIVMIQGITVFIATMYVLINTAVDFIYLAIDPRIRKR